MASAKSSCVKGAHATIRRSDIGRTGVKLKVQDTTAGAAKKDHAPFLVASDLCDVSVEPVLVVGAVAAPELDSPPHSIRVASFDRQHRPTSPGCGWRCSHTG